LSYCRTQKPWLSLTTPIHLTHKHTSYNMSQALSYMDEDFMIQLEGFYEDKVCYSFKWTSCVFDYSCCRVVLWGKAYVKCNKCTAMCSGWPLQHIAKPVVLFQYQYHKSHRERIPGQACNPADPHWSLSFSHISCPVKSTASNDCLRVAPCLCAIGRVYLFSFT